MKQIILTTLFFSLFNYAQAFEEPSKPRDPTGYLIGPVDPGAPQLGFEPQNPDPPKP